MRIYDWPKIISSKQIFYVGGQGVEGSYTSGGVRTVSPEPGGFSFLELQFGIQPNGIPDTMVSWLISKISNGNVFRIPLEKSVQLVKLADIGATTNNTGLPWDNGQPWDNGENWASELLVYASGTALEGTTTLTIYMPGMLQGLKLGHLIGHRDVVYLVDDISYSGDFATVTVDPPLRHDVANSDLITFRPSGLFSAINPENFRGMYDVTDIIELGSARFAEVIV